MVKIRVGEKSCHTNMFKIMPIDFHHERKNERVSCVPINPPAGFFENLEIFKVVKISNTNIFLEIYISNLPYVRMYMND